MASQTVFEATSKLDQEFVVKYALQAQILKVHTNDWHIEHRRYENGEPFSQDELLDHLEEKPYSTGKTVYAMPSDESVQSERNLIQRFNARKSMGLSDGLNDRRQRLIELGYSLEAIDQYQVADRREFLQLQLDRAIENEQKFGSDDDIGIYHSAVTRAQRELREYDTNAAQE